MSLVIFLKDLDFCDLETISINIDPVHKVARKCTDQNLQVHSERIKVEECTGYWNGFASNV